MDVKPEQRLLLDIKTRQKQVVRILTSSSLDVTGANYSKTVRSDFAFDAYGSITVRSVDRTIDRISTYTFFF